MSQTLFSTTDYPVTKLIQDIDLGKIALPGIQRPFVWKASKVRDLFDSMYKGFPVGYLLFWNYTPSTGGRQISTSEKKKGPRRPTRERGGAGGRETADYAKRPCPRSPSPLERGVFSPAYLHRFRTTYPLKMHYGRCSSLIEGLHRQSR